MSQTKKSSNYLLLGSRNLATSWLTQRLGSKHEKRGQPNFKITDGIEAPNFVSIILFSGIYTSFDF